MSARPWWWGEGSPGGLGHLPARLVGVAVLGVPFALVDIPLVHVARIGVRSQWLALRRTRVATGPVTTRATR